MKVLHTIGGFGAKSGGTSTCTYDLLNTINNISNHKVEILTPDVNYNDKLMGEGEEWIKVVPNDYKTPIDFSKNLTNFLKDSDYDIYHTNGLWMHVNHSTCKIARVKKKPYIITPHGMLYPEALARSAWKKWPFRKLWFDKDIKEATCIQVTCEDELIHIRNFGYKGPIALIPNPVPVPTYTKSLFDGRKYDKHEKINIGFLGRIHPRKGINNLIEGIYQSKFKNNLELKIIGSGDFSYIESLKNKISNFNLENNIKFLGFFSGEDKFKELSSLDALFVPSDFENFGMIVPEALIVGTPVMASLGTPWKSLNDNNCGWWTDNSPESIAEVIDKISKFTLEEHKAMGKRGRKFVLENFEATKVASKMLSLYQWILGQSPKPNFVYE